VFLVEDRNPDLFFFLPDDEILLQRKILCAQDLAEQIKEMKAAEKRWESQASSPDFKLSHKKPKKKKKKKKKKPTNTGSNLTDDT